MIEVTVVVSQELLYGFLLGLQELQIAVDLLIDPLVTRVFLPWPPYRLLLSLTPSRAAKRGEEQRWFFQVFLVFFFLLMPNAPRKIQTVQSYTAQSLFG